MHQPVEVLADHYQNTFELTLKLWEQRNRAFLILLPVVGAATLLTINPTKLVAEPLLVDYIAEAFGIEGSDRDSLRAGFPYSLIQSILLMVVLYFMVILYHRTTLITRNYVYLAEMEDEIRKRLGLTKDESSFTREGRFYERAHSPFSQQIALTYIGMLGLLLFSFLGVRIYADFSTAPPHWVAVVDVVLAVPTLLFFVAYSYISSGVLRKLASKLRRKAAGDQ